MRPESLSWVGVVPQGALTNMTYERRCCCAFDRHGDEQLSSFRMWNNFVGALSASVEASLRKAKVWSPIWLQVGFVRNRSFVTFA